MNQQKTPRIIKVVNLNSPKTQKIFGPSISPLVISPHVLSPHILKNKPIKRSIVIKFFTNILLIYKTSIKIIY